MDRSRGSDDPAPLETIEVGGPLGGVVTISATEESSVMVEARWVRNGEARSASAVVGRYASAALARRWADALAAGREPPV